MYEIEAGVTFFMTLFEIVIKLRERENSIAFRL